MNARSPLKETDANLRQPHIALNEDEHTAYANKKRALDRLELQQRKRPKAERARSIEGAVQVAKNTALKNAEQKVTPSELLEWQNNWKKIMRRESRIYFDTADESDCSKYTKSKMDKRKDLLKRGFLSLGAHITQFFDSSVTIVITRRSVDNIGSLSESDVLSRAKKNYMKIWGYEKATRFLKNLDVDLDLLEKNKTASLAEPTLSNLLQNEKLYGPADRDPRTRRDDIHYFKYAHVYMYDQWQTWAPIIVLEWKPQDLADPKKTPYPVLKMGTFGRCPFIGDGACDETSYKRVMKRYNRDKTNKKYALKLRQLYQRHAEPVLETQELVFIPHACLDSSQCLKNWQKTLAAEAEDNEEIEKKSKAIWKDPVVNKTPSQCKSAISGIATLNRQETEDFPDDLCNSKKPSRIMQELKASGVHQSNDVATSFGNGLGPTKASVTNKNVKNLSRLVVDRKLGTKSSNSTASPKITILSGKGSHDEAITIQEATPEKNASEEPKRKKKNDAVAVPLSRKDNAKNAGYCENCRVKYDHLEQHIVSEKHQSFAQNDINFEMIDSLINKLKFQF
ncbi:DBF4 (YDR052C) [Zygosaccharomyces parabailii]|nr:DBF4 (YDR052C) [Zygosaccharomyces parabailii]CDH17314.1 related to DDK kinase regulatory subunit DBF4 [Zygosaccharomyces bailii ISA1307]